MHNQELTKQGYLKRIFSLILFSILCAVLCFVFVDTAYADETETTQEETVYSDGNLSMLPDGTIVEETQPETIENGEIENETNVSGIGDSEPISVPSETDQVDMEEPVSSGEVIEVHEDTQISDSTVYITDSNVVLLSPDGGEDENNVAAFADSDSISVPTDNCIVYEVRILGNDYTAVFPLSVADSLTVSDGVLLNVGASSITGRLFQGDFDTTSYGRYFCTLYPVLGTSGNTNAYRNGSWSYLTEYVPSGTSYTNLTGTNYYGNIYVLEEASAFSGMSKAYLVFFGVWAFLGFICLHDSVRSARRF